MELQFKYIGLITISNVTFWIIKVCYEITITSKECTYLVDFCKYSLVQILSFDVIFSKLVIMRLLQSGESAHTPSWFCTVSLLSWQQLHVPLHVTSYRVKVPFVI